jgi:hypothetical protein
VGKTWLMVFLFQKKIAISSSVETLSSESYHETPTDFGVILATRVIAEQSGIQRWCFYKVNILYCIV